MNSDTLNALPARHRNKQQALRSRDRSDFSATVRLSEGAYSRLGSHLLKLDGDYHLDATPVPYLGRSVQAVTARLLETTCQIPELAKETQTTAQSSSPSGDCCRPTVTSIFHYAYTERRIHTVTCLQCDLFVH